MPNPVSLPVVKTTDYTSPVSWSDDCYIFEERDAWDDSVHRCYYNAPRDVLKRYRFVYKIDSSEQSKIKLMQLAVH